MGRKFSGGNGFAYLTWLRREFLDGHWDESHQDQFDYVYSFPIVKNAIDYELNRKNRNLYMNGRDIDWNIPDPRKLIYEFGSTTGQFAQSGLNFVSSNVTRLYRDNTRQRVSAAYDRGFRNANNYWRSRH